VVGTRVNRYYAENPHRPERNSPPNTGQPLPKRSIIIYNYDSNQFIIAINYYIIFNEKELKLNTAGLSYVGLPVRSVSFWPHSLYVIICFGCQLYEKEISYLI